MVTSLYLKCKLCGSVTMLRYQVGYGNIRIVIPCGHCGCELRGNCVQNDEKVSLTFSFDNAKMVDPCEPQFVAQYSRELLTKKVEPFSPTSMLSLSPFMAMSGYFMVHHDHDSRLQKAVHFVDTELSRLDYIFDLVTLWENNKLDILAKKLNEATPDCPMENPNRLQVSMRLHHILTNFFSLLLPDDWFKSIEIFSLMESLLKASKTQVFQCADFFETRGFLAASEKSLFVEIKRFLGNVPFILPAFALCDNENSSILDERGMFSISYEDLKVCYQNSYEIIANCSDCLIALNGIYHRGDFTSLPNKVGEIETIYDLEKSRSKIKKIENFLPPEECFSKLIIQPLHSHIRNAIGHVTVSYNAITQEITFNDMHMGKSHDETIYLTEFAHMCIENFCTCVYLLEVIYQLRKYAFIENGDIPDPKYTQKYIIPLHSKVGRNELCPCGSGKKYKHCCGG